MNKLKFQQGFRSSRQKKISPFYVIVIFLIIACVGAFFLYQTFVNRFFNPLEIGPNSIDVLELWERGNYEEIIEYAENEILIYPLSTSALTIGGFAYFHSGYEQVNLRERLQLIDRGIVLLRRALVSSDPFLRGEVYYILGKSYYHKGRYYADLAIKFLNLALESGISNSDLYEYLALSYSHLGLYEKSLEFFLESVKSNPSDILFWTLGHTYWKLGQEAQSISFLNQVISSTEDWDLEEKSRFLLGEIYRNNGEYHLAENEYNAILSTNAASADAHFFLGEIFQAKGETEKARSEWRKAFQLDRLHYGANQRLFVR